MHSARELSRSGGDGGANGDGEGQGGAQRWELRRGAVATDANTDSNTDSNTEESTVLHRDRDALGVTAAHGRVPRLPTRVRASLSGADMDSNEGGRSPGPVLAWEGEMRAGPEASEGARQALAAANSSPGNRGRHVVYTAASTATTADTSNGDDASSGASGERAAGVSEPRARAPVSGGGVGVGVATDSDDLYEGGHLFAAPGETAACGSAWQRAWTWTVEDSVLREADPRAGLGQVHDGQWRVIALEAQDLEGSLHLFGTRYPPIKLTSIKLLSTFFYQPHTKLSVSISY